MQFEKLRAELERNGETIQNLLAGITPEEARLKPGPDSWSMLEVICHLYDEEREDFRRRVELLLQRQSDNWPPIDPAGWVTARKYNQQDFSGMLAKWVAERQQSLAWLDRLLPKKTPAKVIFR